MPLTITNIGAILKKVIIPTIQDQLPKESILFDKLKKNSGVTISNNTISAAKYWIGDGINTTSVSTVLPADNWTIKFKWYPTFTGLPSSTTYLFYIANAITSMGINSSATFNNQIQLYITTGGALTMRCYSADGASSTIKTIATYTTAVAGTPVEIEINYLNPYVITYLNGALATSISSMTSVRSASIESLQLTNEPMSDFQIFTPRVHTDSLASWTVTALPTSTVTSSLITTPAVTVSGTTAATSTSTGSIINAGGLGNAGSAYIGGKLNVADTTGATSGTTGCAVFGGGLGVGGA
jgi:hypothetical protein